MVNKRPDHSKRMKEINKEKLVRYNNEVGLFNKRCPKCKIIKSITEYAKNKRGFKGVQVYCSECRKSLAKIWRNKNKERLIKYSSKIREQNKRIVIGHYSNNLFCCGCCGENNYDFLQIDHMNNNGNKHRKEIGLIYIKKDGKIKTTSGDAFYRWLINNNFPESFQILCANCNFSKSKNGGICIHKK